MAELSLEPYAVVQHWRLPEADGRWEAILSEYLQTIAQTCSTAGKCVIGHIKALAVFPEGGFFRVSVVAANIPASTQGSVPLGCTGLDLTLNVLVYGLERSVIEQITREKSREAEIRWKGAVIHQKQNPTDPHMHHE